jgi:hypothetical protein
MITVDFARACHIVGSPGRLEGVSEWNLVERVQESPTFADGSKPLTPAIGLEDGLTIYPFRALHWLSYATRPRYQDDLVDTYLYWGLARYIGLFEHSNEGFSVPKLMLSDAGRRIRGNQRRVTSEEMGIGFGVLLANYWFERTGAAGLPVSVVDVDVALDDRYVFAGGSRHAVRAIKDRRPDYLLIAPDSSRPRRYRIRALECKGTSSAASYAVRQLVSAAEQLTGITVEGRIPRGLAVSTLTRNDQLSYLAIDPGEDDEPSYLVNSGTVDQAVGFQLQDDVRDVPPDLLTNASVRASWAALADFSGNMPALDRWAPGMMRRRLTRQQRQRQVFETPYGPADGTSVVLAAGGQQMRLRYAVAAAIDQHLTGPAEAIADAQFAFAQQLASSGSPLGPDQGFSQIADRSVAVIAGDESSSSVTVYSATLDGSIFSITIS